MADQFKYSKPKSSSTWNTISDIAKALAPVWVITFAASCVMGGLWLVIYTDVLLPGILMIALCWIVMGLGWGPACDLSRQILGGHR